MARSKQQDIRALPHWQQHGSKATSEGGNLERTQDDELRKEETSLDEVYAPPPVQDIHQGPTIEQIQTGSTRERGDLNALSGEEAGVNELFAPPSDENSSEDEMPRHIDSEDQSPGALGQEESEDASGASETKLSRFLTQLYIYSYLVCFSILGVLAIVGLQALTIYPGALVPNTDLWANFAGCLIIGFLHEDTMLFRRYWQKAQREHEKHIDSTTGTGGSSKDTSTQHADESAAAITAVFRASRAQVPGYLGLTVGFCGSFTSFSSVARDALAISNNINTDDTANHLVAPVARSRETGHSVMAVLGVVILEVGLSIIALKMGAHLAIVTERLSGGARVKFGFSKIVNPLFVVLAWGIWIGTIVMTVFSPHDTWRGEVLFALLFALLFAPLGCIMRFQLSVKMNLLMKSFPLRTFTANILGTAILGMSYDLQHSSATRSIIGCQILQKIEDGFCGALTTVSTWVLELDALRLRHAYMYGGYSIVLAIVSITAVMDPSRWTEGFISPTCST